MGGKELGGGERDEEVRCEGVRGVNGVTVLILPCFWCVLLARI